MVVLDEGNYLPARLHSLNVFNIVVDGCILVALIGIVEYFLEYCNVLESQLAARVALSLHVRQMQILLHLLEHLR